MDGANVNSLARPEVRAMLERLHHEARLDYWRNFRLIPRIIMNRIRGKSFSETMTPTTFGNCYHAVPRGEGEFLYLAARSIGARNVVEFGTSFGISTIYLACAVRDNGGGIVIGTELIAKKHAQAIANLSEAGLADYADVRLGNALESLRNVPEPVDLVFLDGRKNLYLPVLQLLKSKIRPGSLVLADNINSFKTDLRPYVEYVKSGQNGFVSTTLSISDGLEYSYFVGHECAD